MRKRSWSPKQAHAVAQILSRCTLNSRLNSQISLPLAQMRVASALSVDKHVLVAYCTRQDGNSEFAIISAHVLGQVRDERHPTRQRLLGCLFADWR